MKCFTAVAAARFDRGTEEQRPNLPEPPPLALAHGIGSSPMFSRASAFVRVFRRKRHLLSARFSFGDASRVRSGPVIVPAANVAPSWQHRFAPGVMQTMFRTGRMNGAATRRQSARAAGAPV